MTEQTQTQLCALAAQHRAEIAFLKALVASRADETTLTTALDGIVRHLNERLTAVIATALTPNPNYSDK